MQANACLYSTLMYSFVEDGNEHNGKYIAIQWLSTHFRTSMKRGGMLVTYVLSCCIVLYKDGMPKELMLGSI